MKIIIGLGNPGQEYEKTRHNVGFLMLNYLQKNLNFSAFQLEKKFKAEISENQIKSEKVILAKPQTFMNNSGQTAQALINFYKIEVENLIVIHDELDVAFGEFKISTEKNSAGHNGVQDIINHLSSKSFTRIRIGIENRNEIERKNIIGSDYVLGRWQKDELITLEKIFQEILIKIEKKI
jgi:PTH1 family peptidyl-tRNA hydrolase